MIDMSIIAAGLQSIKTALDITKDLRNIDFALKDAEIKLKLTELLDALSTVKIQVVEMRDENLNLKDKLRELEDKLSQKDEVEFKDGFYYVKNAREGQAPGPFCAKCYSDDDTLITVSELPSSFQDFGKYECPKCRAISGQIT